MYDVIIIGAGPTGSSAAKKLADDGFNVLMVERLKMPRNKSCSGILIKKSVNMIKAYFGEDIPKDAICEPSENKGMIYKNDDGKEYKYEQKGISIKRNVLDFWLVNKTVESGVKFKDETAVIACEEREHDVKVTLRGETEYTEKAKIVITCDGNMGTMKHKLAGTNHGHIFTYQTFNKGTIDLDPHYFYNFLQPDLSEYNAWFNVKDDYLVFGVAGKNMGKIEQYYAKFINYMKSQYNLEIDTQERIEKWTMPHIAPGCPIDYGKGRIMFAGEAAGFLNPMGEGISAALECGHEAAKAISMADDFDMQKVYAAYKSNVAELKAYMERQWRLIGSTSTKFAYMK